MPIKIRPADPTDLPAYDRVMTCAFPHGLRQYIYPKGRSQADIAHGLQTCLESLDDDQTFCMVAYDTERAAPPEDFMFPDGFDVPPECIVPEAERPQKRRAVGFAVWLINMRDRPKKEKKDKTKPPTSNAQVIEDYYAALEAGRKKHLEGIPYLILNILGIHPEMQRKGVGSLLLDWGLELAKEKDILVWLEASVAGRPLYSKWGFEEVDVLEFDIKKYGAEKNLFNWLMMKPVAKIKHEEHLENGSEQAKDEVQGIEASPLV